MALPFVLVFGCALPVDERSDYATADPFPLSPDAAVEELDLGDEPLLDEPFVLPEGIRALPTGPGEFSMTLEGSWRGGCSRGMHHSQASAALSLSIAADSSAVACRARAETTMSTFLDRGFLPGSDSPRRYASSFRSSRERAGYRGTWRAADDGSIAITLLRDDAVCDPLAEGVTPRSLPLELRCMAIEGELGQPEASLPGRGLLCIVVGEGAFEHHGWTVSSGLLLLGEEEGWAIDERRERLRGELAVSRPASPIRVDDVLATVPTL